MKYGEAGNNAKEGVDLNEGLDDGKYIRYFVI